MRVFVDLTVRDDGQLVCLVEAGGDTTAREVRWAGADRSWLLVHVGDGIADEDAAELAARVDRGTATVAELKRYGGLLFDAALGQTLWRDLAERAADSPYLELAVRGPSERGDLAGHDIQGLRWEALYDGTTFLAARGTQTERGTCVSAGIMRLVPADDEARQQEFRPIQRIPRVLFAVGSRLTDPRVRPGAEFMGILRHLERKGGAIQPRVLESASIPSLVRELAQHQPDVLHLIGHGRWFPVDRCVKLQMRAETDGDEWVTAEQLLGAFGESGHTPAVVVLSACQSGAVPESGSALPFAARLVAGGIPVVVAMAGDIADTACRVFTRALTTAIGQGTPLLRAIVLGRRAAFFERPDPDSVDWIMPVLFRAEHVDGGATLVDITAAAAARHRARLLDVVWEPVFCGRGEFIAAMDRLLDQSDPLNVLVAHQSDPQQHFGGKRLLRELAARAVRAGRLPVLLGPFDSDPPTDRGGLADALHDKLGEIRDNLGLPARPAQITAAAAAPKAKAADLARAIRADFALLEDDLPDTDPVRLSPRPRVVLLCHRVDRWLEALDDLLDMLRPQGLGPGAHPVPVIMTGADGAEQGLPLLEARLNRFHGASWIEFQQLGRLRSEDSDPEDILAYQWWLLNPARDKQPVYAPRRGSSPAGWHGLLRWAMAERRLYDEQALFGFARVARDYFTPDMDNDVLAAFAKVSP